MGCGTTDFADSDTDSESFLDDWEEFCKINAANEARIGTNAPAPKDCYNVRTTKNNYHHEYKKTGDTYEEDKKSEDTYEEYKKTTTTTMHTQGDELALKNQGIEAQELESIPNYQGWDREDEDFEPIYVDDQNHGGYEVNYKGNETDHRVYGPNRVQGTISVALVRKEDISESETGSDAPLAPIYQKGAEIMCRFRPANENEHGDDQCVQYGDLDADLKRSTDWELVDDEARWDALTKDETVCEVHTPKGSAHGKSHDFEFDRLFPPKCNNRNMYNVLRKQWFPSLVGGMSVGIIPYGVTGTGKSYTVHGTREDPGMVPLFCQEVFRRLETDYGGKDFKTKIRVSFLEIYENKIVDLLQYRKVTKRCKATKPLDPGRGLIVSHDKEKPFSTSPVPMAIDLEVQNTEELLKAFWIGYDRLRRMRVVDRGLIRKISLSSSVFILTILRKHMATGMTTNAQFQVVDLGGPFKPSDLRAKNGKPLTPINSRILANLNKSLVSFRKVMLFSDTKSTGRHKPYRDSKITQILEPLLEKGKTAIIIHVSGCSENARNTIETLRFGLNASQLFKEEINQDVQVNRVEVEEEEPEYFTETGKAVPRGVDIR